jgi:hypothetical protein
MKRLQKPTCAVGVAAAQAAQAAQAWAGGAMTAQLAHLGLRVGGGVSQALLEVPQLVELRLPQQRLHLPAPVHACTRQHPPWHHQPRRSLLAACCAVARAGCRCRRYRRAAAAAAAAAALRASAGPRTLRPSGPCAGTLRSAACKPERSVGWLVTSGQRWCCGGLPCSPCAAAAFCCPVQQELVRRLQAALAVAAWNPWWPCWCTPMHANRLALGQRSGQAGATQAGAARMLPGPR